MREPNGAAQGVEWPRDSLDLLPELASFEGVAPWLYQQLKQSGRLAELPLEVAARLRTATLEAAMFNLRVDEEAAAVLALLSAAELPVILLKGVARRALATAGSYDALRLTTDVDLLLPAEAARRAFALLLGHGYATLPAGPGAASEHHHLPGLWGERHIGVELHLSFSPLVRPAEAWRRASEAPRQLEWQGLRVRVPSPTELAWHTLTHAPTETLTLGFRLRTLLDFVTLLTREAGIAWETIATRLEQGEASDALSPDPVPSRTLRAWLAAAASLAPDQAIPLEAARPAFDLRPLLRWRLRILANRGRLGDTWTGRLLAESARVAAGLPAEPAPARAGLPLRLRDWLLGRASRTAFRTWRAVAGRGRAA